MLSSSSFGISLFRGDARLPGNIPDHQARNERCNRGNVLAHTRIYVKRVSDKPRPYSRNERDDAETDNVHNGYPESRDFEKMFSVNHFLSFQTSDVYL
jgi:hypothetical protein